MVLSGVVDLMLGAILPGTSAWAMGLLIGINMILGGSALIVMGRSDMRTGRVNPI
jgi:uncharacterized membrane protein HdeD (DUF308 family)